MKEYQVTLMDSSNKYRPVSCIVKVDIAEDVVLTTELKKKILREGAQKRFALNVIGHPQTLRGMVTQEVKLESGIKLKLMQKTRLTIGN